MAAYGIASPQMVFQQQYAAVRRDEFVGVLLALFLGGFGIHKFYLGQTGMGLLYLIFSWTGIPWVLGWIECFFMPGRVRIYNAIQAGGIAAALGMTAPAWVNYPGFVPPGFAGSGFAGQSWAGSSQVPVYVSVNSGGAGSIGGSEPGGQPVLTACRQCGRANGTGSRFCSGCGQPLG